MKEECEAVHIELQDLLLAQPSPAPRTEAEEDLKSDEGSDGSVGDASRGTCWLLYTSSLIVTGKDRD